MVTLPGLMPAAVIPGRSMVLLIFIGYSDVIDAAYSRADPSLFISKPKSL